MTRTERHGSLSVKTGNVVQTDGLLTQWAHIGHILRRMRGPAEPMGCKRFGHCAGHSQAIEKSERGRGGEKTRPPFQYPSLSVHDDQSLVYYYYYYYLTMNYRLRLPCMAADDYVFVHAGMYATSKTLTNMAEDMAGEQLAEFTMTIPIEEAAATRQSLELFCVDLSQLSPSLGAAVGLSLVLDFLEDSRLLSVVRFMTQRHVEPLLEGNGGSIASDRIRAAFGLPDDTGKKKRKVLDMYVRVLTGERL